MSEACYGMTWHLVGFNKSYTEVYHEKLSKTKQCPRSAITKLFGVLWFFIHYTLQNRFIKTLP